MRKYLVAVLSLSLFIAACGGIEAEDDATAAEPVAVADTLSRARAIDGQYISWKEVVSNHFLY